MPTLVALAALHRLSQGLPAWIVLKPVFAVLLLPQTWRFVRCVGSDLSSIGEGDEQGRRGRREREGQVPGAVAWPIRRGVHHIHQGCLLGDTADCIPLPRARHVFTTHRRFHCCQKGTRCLEGLAFTRYSLCSPYHCSSCGVWLTCAHPSRFTAIRSFTPPPAHSLTFNPNPITGQEIPACLCDSLLIPSLTPPTLLNPPHSIPTYPRPIP